MPISFVHLIGSTELYTNNSSLKNRDGRPHSTSLRRRCKSFVARKDDIGIAIRRFATTTRAYITSGSAFQNRKPSEVPETQRIENHAPSIEKLPMAHKKPDRKPT